MFNKHLVILKKTSGCNLISLLLLRKRFYNGLTLVSRSERAFTLIELMVSITILAILSAAGIVAYTNVQKNARDTKRKEDVQQIAKAYEYHYDATKQAYPTLGPDAFSHVGPTPPRVGDYSTVFNGQAKYLGFRVCSRLEAGTTTDCQQSPSDSNCFCVDSVQGPPPPVVSNVNTSDLTYMTGSGTANQTLNLNTGWNFIGLAVDKGTGYTASQLSSDIGSNVGIITEGQCLQSNTNTTLRCYSPPGSSIPCPSNTNYSNGTSCSFLQGDFPIYLGRGYFIRVTSRSNPTITGTVVTGINQLSLISGWNFLSLPVVPNSIPTAEALGQSIISQGVNATSAIWWTNGNFSSHLIGQNDGNDFTLNPGMGFAINISGPLNYQVPPPVPTATPAPISTPTPVIPTNTPTPIPPTPTLPPAPPPDFVASFSSFCTNPSQRCDSQCINIIPPSEPVIRNQKYNASVTFKNTGTGLWDLSNGYRLGSQATQDNVTWGIGRAFATGQILPGGQVTFTFSVTAPSQPGWYNFEWKMLEEGVAWFGGVCTPPTKIYVY